MHLKADTNAILILRSLTSITLMKICSIAYDSRVVSIKQIVLLIR